MFKLLVPIDANATESGRMDTINHPAGPYLFEARRFNIQRIDSRAED